MFEGVGTRALARVRLTVHGRTMILRTVGAKAYTMQDSNLRPEGLVSSRPRKG